MEKPNAIH